MCLPVDVWVSKYAHLCGPHVRGEYPGPPSQVLPAGPSRGYLDPPSKVLPAVLPNWSFRGGTQPSFPGPSSSPSQLVPLVGSHVTYPIMYLVLPVCSPVHHGKGHMGPLSGGVPCDLSHNALDVTCLLPSALWERSHGTP